MEPEPKLADVKMVDDLAKMEDELTAIIDSNHAMLRGFDVLMKGYRTMAKHMIAKGFKTSETAMAHLIEGSPYMKDDEMFQALFPDCFLEALDSAQQLEALKSR